VPVTIIVPRGAEEGAVRRAAPGGSIAAIAAGARSAALPDMVVPGRVAIVVGLCGSLTAARVGDVVVYARIVTPDGVEPLDPDQIDLVRSALPQARLVGAVTADHVITTAAERAELAARSGADVVDMEASHLARALRGRGVLFAMVRVVSDDPRADLPPIGDALDANGGIRPLALAGAFARAPFAAVRFVRDVQASLGVLSSTGGALAALK
jgi:adenosylhomocysteine nucleosidase